MLKDTINTWYAAGFYHIRYAGTYKTFANYIDAKAHIDAIMQSVWFMGAQNDNARKAV